MDRAHAHRQNHVDQAEDGDRRPDLRGQRRQSGARLPKEGGRRDRPVDGKRPKSIQ